MFCRVAIVSCVAVVTRDTGSFLWCGRHDSSILVIPLLSPEDDAHHSRLTTEMLLTQGQTTASAVSQGKVVSIELHPENEMLILVGFAEGQIVLYDLEAEVIQRRFDHSGQVRDWQSADS